MTCTNGPHSTPIKINKHTFYVFKVYFNYFFPNQLKKFLIHEFTNETIKVISVSNNRTAPIKHT